MTRSKLLSVNTRDFLHGLIVAVLIAALTCLQTELTANSHFDMAFLRRLAWSSAIGFVAYLIKKLAQNSKGDLLTKEETIVKNDPASNSV